MRTFIVLCAVSLGCGAVETAASSLENAEAMPSPSSSAPPTQTAVSPMPDSGQMQPTENADAGLMGADAGRVNMATRVWDSQADVFRWLSDELTMYRRDLAGWSNLATRLSGSSARVMYGTLTEVSIGVFTWTGTPRNELVVQALDAPYRYRIAKLVGDISSNSFPYREGDILVMEVTYGQRIIGVTYGSELQKLVGSMLIGPNGDLALVSLENQITRSTFVGPNAAVIESSRFETGSGMVLGARNLRYTWEYQAYMCTGSPCARDDLSTAHTTVDTDVDGASYRLDYTRTETNRYRTGAQWRIGWQGTASQGGRFYRERIAGSSYGLFFSIGTDRHLVSTVTSFD